jgi:hypothetical protein
MQDEKTLEVVDKLLSSYAHNSACHRIAHPSVIHRRWKVLTMTGRSSGKSQEPDFFRLLSALRLSCFGSRKATPAIYCIGVVTRGTVISVR